MGCNAIGDINKNGQIDYFCTSLHSQMAKTDEGIVDRSWLVTAYSMVDTTEMAYRVFEKKSCSNDVPKDVHTYPTYDKFCKEPMRNCFRPGDVVITEEGKVKKIKNFELQYRFDNETERHHYGFKVVLEGCELVSLDSIKRAPRGAEKFFHVRNAVISIYNGAIYLLSLWGE